MNFTTTSFLRNILFTTLFLLLSFTAFAQGSESFDSPSWSSYRTGTVNFASGTWDMRAVYRATGSETHTGAAACRINDDVSGAYLTTPPLSGGVGVFSFYYRELNSGGGTFEILKSVNGGSFTSVGTHNYSGQSWQAYSITVNEGGSNVEIRILSDDNSGHLVIDDVSWTGYASSAPEISVTQGATNIPDNSGSYSFGSNNIGTPVTQTFTIHNTGTATLTLGTVSVNNANFTVTQPLSSSVAAGGTTTFTVTHDPAVTGSHSGTVSFSNNDADESPYNFTVSGTGVTPLPACTTPSAASALSFGTVTTSQISGSFTASGAESYLVIRSTSATPPTVTDGSNFTNYGTYVTVQNSASTSFTETGLTANTTYYFYVYAYNGPSCSGGPLYATAITGNETTNPLPTTVQFTTTSGSVTEGTATYTITASISNPSNVSATSANVTLGSGNGRVNGFTNQTLTWAAGDNTNKSITLLVTDNSNCEGTDNLEFNLGSVSGGTSASAGTNNSFDLEVVDNDLTNGVQYGQGFELTAGITDNWTYSSSGTSSLNTSAARTGNRGRILGNGNIGTDTYDFMNIAGFTNSKITLYTEGVGGLENLGDYFEVYVAFDGAAFSSTPEVTVHACNNGSTYNVNWSYTANGVAAKTVNGSNTDYFGCSSINGIAKIELTLPNGYNTVAIKIRAETTSGGEYFYYDDLTLEGEYCAAPVPTIITSTTGPLNFGNVTVGGNATQTFTVEGTDLTDPIAINAPTGYQVSTDGVNFYNSLSLTPSAGSVSTTTITVRFSPVTNTTYNGNIEHTSTGASQVDVAVTGSGTVPCTTPLNQATNLNLSPAATSITGNFTAAAGGADGYLVVVSTSSSLGATPSNTTTYTAGQSLGSGTVVSSSTGTSFIATGLSTTTQYYLHVFAYNNAACTGGPLYKTPALVNNATTLASPFAAFDVFDRADNDNLGIPSSGGAATWGEVDAGGSDAVEVYSNRLDINSYSGDTAAWAYFDMSPLYATNYDAATSELVWMFNMASTRYNPSGFGLLNNYGAAVVLGADGTNFHTGANGYAVTLGETGSVDQLRLVRFSGGLVGGTHTTIAADGGDWDDELFSVKVTYNPINGLWTLETYDGGYTMPFTDPAATTYTTNNTGTDQTYTGTDLPYFGAFWNMANSSGGEYASFDNFYRPTAQSCTNNTWTGTISTDWFDAGNWSCNEVPTSSTTVVIPNVSGTSGNFPEVAGISGFTAYTGDLTINTGASVTVLGVNNVNLEVYGDLTNNGVASVGNGRVIFKGTAVQTITGTVTFTHLDINNASGVILGTGTKTVYGALSLVNGNLTTNNRLTIGSNATRTGLVDEFTTGYTGTMSGNLTVERYANNTSSGFFYIGAPVGGASVTNWTGISLATQNGATNGSQVIPTPTCSITELAVGSPYGRLFDYRENQVNTCNLEGWHVRTSGAIGNAQGFASRVSSGTVIGLNGSFVTGPVTSVNLTYTANSAPAPGSGFNLVANPYAAPIDWVSVASANTGSINGTAYMYQTSGGFAGTYNAVNQISGGGQIGTSQSFFVEATGNNVTINFDNSMKRNGANNTLRTTPVYENKLVANVSGNGYADKAIIAFGSNFTTGYDADFDARKLMSKVGQPSLYVNNGMNLAINAEPSIAQTQLIPLHMKAGADGTFLLEFDMSEFDPTAMIYLEDLKDGTMQNLWLNNSYSFAANVTDDADRFVLHFYPAMQISTTDQTCAGNDGALYLVQTGGTEWDYTLTDVDGNVVDANAQLNGSHTATNLANGSYQMVLTHASGHTVTRTIAISGVAQVTANIESVLTAQVGEIISFDNTSAGATSYTWNFGDGNTSTDATPAHTYNVAGTYTVTMTASNGTCTDVYSITLKVNDLVNSINELINDRVQVYSFNNILYVSFSSELKGIAELDLYNVTGQKVWETRKLDANGQHELSLSNLVNGYYIVKLNSSNGTAISKVYVNAEK